jgi:hypothetical protein
MAMNEVHVAPQCFVEELKEAALWAIRRQRLPGSR